MRDWTLGDVAALTGGRLSGAADTRVGGVCIDTRALKRGDLYVAIRGERLDGHQFVRAAFRRGACGAVVEKAVAFSGPRVTVADTKKALAALGRARRLQWNGPVVAVTGSVGKTTVKDLIAHLLAGDAKTAPALATRGNLNNRYGLPLTLLRLEGAHRSAVVELGINRPGEMGMLADIARPDVAVVTAAGKAHLGFFTGVAQVAREKLRLLGSLRKGGRAVLNADHPRLALAARKGKAILFGLAWGTVRARDIRLGTDRTFFTLVAGGKRYAAQVRLLGAHQAANAAAAVSAGLALGLRPEALVRRLRTFRPVSGMRMQSVLKRGVRFVNDAYNASPDSMEAALSVFGRLKGKRKAAVLGDMRELGAFSKTAHREALKRVESLRLDALFLVGPAMARAAEGLRLGHLVLLCGTADEAGRCLKGWARRGDLILLKGSRAMGIEKALEAF